MPASRPRNALISIAWTADSLYNAHISMFMRSPRCIKKTKPNLQNANTCSRLCQIQSGPPDTPNLLISTNLYGISMESPLHSPQPKLLDQVRQAIRRKGYSYRTEQTYVQWIKRFILFHKERRGQYIHPQQMGAPEIEAFLTWLAVDQHVAASTQNQARSALLFLYDHVLNQPIQQPIRPVMAKKPSRTPHNAQTSPNASLLTSSATPSPPTSSIRGSLP